jgi:hypothetical protein
VPGRGSRKRHREDGRPGRHPGDPASRNREWADQPSGHRDGDGRDTRGRPAPGTEQVMGRTGHGLSQGGDGCRDGIRA